MVAASAGKNGKWQTRPWRRKEIVGDGLRVSGSKRPAIKSVGLSAAVGEFDDVSAALEDLLEAIKKLNYRILSKLKKFFSGRLNTSKLQWSPPSVSPSWSFTTKKTTALLMSLKLSSSFVTSPVESFRIFVCIAGTNAKSCLRIYQSRGILKEADELFVELFRRCQPSHCSSEKNS